MLRTVRSFAVAGVAVVGAGVIAASPSPAPLKEAQLEARDVAVRMVANSIANIPANVLQTIANIPAVQHQAVDQTVAALQKSGNWWLYIPTNVVGFDQQDLEKVQAISLLLMPVPLVATALADQLSITLAAEAPMTADCTGIPGPCTDPIYFTDYFRIPVSQLLTGYTFPADLRNPIDPNDPSVQPQWAGQTVTLDMFGPAKAIWQTLTQDPATSTSAAPTPAQWTNSLDELAQATWASVNPFVTGTYCLPCQLVVAGAPGSLPKFALLGEYYTMFDLGQQLTSQNWVGNPYSPTADPDWIQNVTVTNLWTKQSWDQISADAVKSVKDFVDQMPGLPKATRTDLAAAAARVSALLRGAVPATAARGSGDAKGLDAVAASFENLAVSAGGFLPSAGKATAPFAGLKKLTATVATTTGVPENAPAAGDAGPRSRGKALFGSREGRQAPKPGSLPKLRELRAGARDAAESLRGGAGLAGLKPIAGGTQDAQTSQDTGATGETQQKTRARLADRGKARLADRGKAGAGSSATAAGQPGLDQPAVQAGDRARKPRGPVGAAAKSAGERLSTAASKVADGFKRAGKAKPGDTGGGKDDTPATRPERGRVNSSDG